MNRADYAKWILLDLADEKCGEVRQPGAVLKIEGDRYVMRNERGTEVHELDIASTDPERLLAHWEGFTGRVFDGQIIPPQMVATAPLRPGAFDWWDNPCPRRGW